MRTLPADQRDARIKAAALGHARRSERDEAAANGIPPELLALWKQTRRLYKGNPGQRAERFTEYAESNPREVIAAMQCEADRKLVSLVGERERNAGCTERGCTTPVHARGLCPVHYRQSRKQGVA